MAQDGHSLRIWKWFAQTINALRDLENEIYGVHRNEGHIFIEMTRIAHRQFAWQTSRPSDVLLTRYYKIFSDPGIDDIVQSRLGLSVREIYACAASVVGHFLGEWRLQLPITSEIIKLPVEKFEKFFAFTCRELTALRRLLKQEQRYDDRYAYAFNSLRAYPILRMRHAGRDVVVCPIPTFLLWRVTNGLFYDLVGDQRFGDLFGRAFERYIGEVIARSLITQRCRAIPERIYPSSKGVRKTVDWIVVDGDEASLFIECKAKRMKWDAKVAFTQLEALDEDIEQLAQAVVQSYKAIQEYRLNRHPDFPFSSRMAVYPIVVTLENWQAFGAGIVSRLDAAVHQAAKGANIAAEMLHECPYSIWATEEIEVAIGLVDRFGIKAIIEPKQQSPDMRSWGMLPYLLHQFKSDWPKEKLFPEGSDEIFGHLV